MRLIDADAEVKKIEEEIKRIEQRIQIALFLMEIPLWLILTIITDMNVRLLAIFLTILSY